jgi:hypothetical protein
MNHRHARPLAYAFLALLAGATAAQAQSEQTRSVMEGGVHVPGWMGSIDKSEASNGMKLEDASLAMDGSMLHVTTGPAASYWNPSNTASGDYTVKATFTEPEYMNLNSHPHPYGIFIGGSDMGTDQQSYLYCAAYGNGNFIVRGFSPEPFQMNGRRGEASDAVHKAAGQGQPVTQEIALSVRGGKVECAINGTVVGSYDHAAVLTAGLKSTDGVYGIRFGHNTEAKVSGLGVTR